MQNNDEQNRDYPMEASPNSSQEPAREDAQEEQKEHRESHELRESGENAIGNEQKLSNHGDAKGRNAPPESLYRVEVIGNQSVFQDLLLRSEERGAMKNYTLMSEIYGSGSSGKRLGDSVWPEENFICIIYCGKEEMDIIADVVAQIKLLFSYEGIKMFSLPDAQEIH